MWKKIRGWWWARQRAMDLDILWPAIVARSHGSMEDAHHAFLMHAVKAPCWNEHYGDDLANVVWRLR